MKWLVVLLGVLALAGCGAEPDPSSAEKFKGEQRAVAQKVEDLQDAGRGGKAEDICSDILASSLVQEIEQAGGDCADEMKKAIEDAQDYKLDVRKVTISGSDATVEVRRGDDGPTGTMEFTKENGQWRATSLSGS
jgi:hypothetical protein